MRKKNIAAKIAAAGVAALMLVTALTSCQSEEKKVATDGSTSMEKVIAFYPYLSPLPRIRADCTSGKQVCTEAAARARDDGADTPIGGFGNRKTATYSRYFYVVYGFLPTTPEFMGIPSASA